MAQKRQMGFPNGGRYRAVVLALVLFALGAAPAGAVTITAKFISFPTAPTSARGGGNLTDIFDTAIDYWEKAIPSSGSSLLHIWVGWGAFARKYSSVLAATFIPPSKNTLYHYPPRYADIVFDSAGSGWSWFLDPTPADNSEYSIFTPSSKNLGGGTVNTGRVFTGASGAAAGRVDLLSVALHEIGHALGFTPSSGASVVVANPLPDVGTSILTTTDGHIDIGTAVLYPWLTRGTRKLLTGVDILGVAQLAGYESVDLNPVPVPLPGGLVLMASGLAALGARAGRRRRAA